MNFDLTKTLEQLDGHVWDIPNYNSSLVKTCHLLRKKPLNEFKIEDLRIMIGQNFNLNFLIPIAIEKLKENILAEGRFYEGDLLNSVLTSEKKFWLENKKDWQICCGLFENSMELLKEFDTTDEIKESWFKNFQIFKSLVVSA